MCLFALLWRKRACAVTHHIAHDLKVTQNCAHPSSSLSPGVPIIHELHKAISSKTLPEALPFPVSLARALWHVPLQKM